MIKLTFLDAVKANFSKLSLIMLLPVLLGASFAFSEEDLSRSNKNAATDSARDNQGASDSLSKKISPDLSASKWLSHYLNLDQLYYDPKSDQSTLRIPLRPDFNSNNNS